MARLWQGPNYTSMRVGCLNPGGLLGNVCIWTGLASLPVGSSGGPHQAHDSWAIGKVDDQADRSGKQGPLT